MRIRHATKRPQRNGKTGNPFVWLPEDGMMQVITANM